ncbi:hypothetical protein pb186bvf_020383 [Paramecium bursaria]
MRVYPLSDYKVKELKLAELKKNHFKSPSEALFQKNRPYFEIHKPSGIGMDDFVSYKWELLPENIQWIYIYMYQQSKRELYQAFEQLLIEPKIPPPGIFIFAKTQKYLDPTNKIPIQTLYMQLTQKERDEYEYQHSKLMEQYWLDRKNWKELYSTYFSNNYISKQEVMDSYKKQKIQYELLQKEEQKKLMRMSNKEVIMRQKQNQMNQIQDSQRKSQKKELDFISNFLGQPHRAQFIDL